MNRRQTLGSIAALLLAGPALATVAAEPAPGFRFPSIDGGTLDTAEWRGRPVLVVNTASLCGFTPQLEGLQKLHEDYESRGLVVLATPSNDFNQELDDARKVKEFCTLQYGITLPMTDIIHVKSGDVHPFYRWLQDTVGHVPGWNFNKVLLGPDGQVVGTWGSTTAPGSDALRRAFEPLLPG
ncbi:glutathione peroxidase [uncultured Paracoccus sp.]|uniref:glutathione peroxidase n=1 Tax=uncultured Paracoccus sp. TaxID=189685 RepID=UPI002621A928|nr:glutathione peroxidase [uncultured Paracoccus sp.]